MQLTGFAAKGFRSFYELQHVPLDGKLTVISGLNNSGKSNALLFADRVLGSMKSDREGKLDLLDESQVELGSDPIPLTVGFAIDIGTPEGVGQRAINANLQPGTQVSHIVDQVLQCIAATSERQDGKLWAYWECPKGEALRPSQAQCDAAADLFIGSRPGDTLADVTSQYAGGSGYSNASENIKAWIQKLSQVTEYPKVVLIPAHRRIVNDEQVKSEISDLSGMGFTGLLQALQAPSAATYRADRRRFSAINDFLRQVTEDPSAEISVPHDSTTVHVRVAGQVFPLANLGAGIEQVIVIATIATHYGDHLICIEEPELHLHPTLLRQLLNYLERVPGSRYLISTHSAQLLDYSKTVVLGAQYDKSSGSSVSQLVSRANRADLSFRLGYRASDIVQSNYIVWVEGPSDRVYIRHWISLQMPSLVEGVHYSILHYGGRLLSHLTALDSDAAPDETDLVSLIQVNRNMAIVMDSDCKKPRDQPNDTKQRVRDEFKNVGGAAWITEGREIENYVPIAEFADAVASVHPSADWNPPPASLAQYRSRFSFVTSGKNAKPGTVRSADKVAIARAVVAIQTEVPRVLDLRVRVDELARRIATANDLRETHP